MRKEKMLQIKNCPNVGEVKVSGEEESNLGERYIFSKMRKTVSSELESFANYFKDTSTFFCSE